MKIKAIYIYILGLIPIAVIQVLLKDKINNLLHFIIIITMLIALNRLAVYFGRRSAG